jgi:hypothetical protein
MKVLLYIDEYWPRVTGQAVLSWAHNGVPTSQEDAE